MQIAEILTAEKVLTVTSYHAKQKGWTMPDNLYGWNKKSIAGILNGENTPAVPSTSRLIPNP